jgi:myo-inositol-1(or 4)-monophosphatase
MNEFPQVDKFLTEWGEYALAQFHSGILSEEKDGVNDVVTEVDRTIDRKFYEFIVKAYPGDGIFSEESQQSKLSDSGFTWMIDPIDGTRNFAFGIPQWAIMITRYKTEGPQHSWIAVPGEKRLYKASLGKGAFCNGKQLRVASRKSIDHAYGVVVIDKQGERFALHLSVIEQFLNRNGWLVNSGCMSAAGHVAGGGADFLLHNCGYDYDYLAAALIVREAGGVAITPFGDDWKLGSRELILANHAIGEELVKLFQQNAARK